MEQVLTIGPLQELLEGLAQGSIFPRDGGRFYLKVIKEESGSVLRFGHQGSFYPCKSPSGAIP